MTRKNSKPSKIAIGKLTRRTLRIFCSNKKGASQVVSTVILTAGVLAMSIAVLYWTYSMGKIGNIEYSKNTAASSSAIFERIGFETVQYNANAHTISASIINWGKTDNITIAHVLILNSTYDYVGSNTGVGGIQLHDVGDGTNVNSLRIGKDATFTTQVSGQISSGDMYYMRLVTSRGRNFDFAFTP